MRKSLLNVIILALVLINLILTVLLTFSLVSTTKKTDNLITKIAGIIDLDIANNGGEDPTDSQGPLNVEDIETLEIKTSDGSPKIIITIADANNKMHQVVVNSTISLNKTSKDYEKLKMSVTNGMQLIVAEINTVVSRFTFENVLQNRTSMETELQQRLQEMFKSDIIYQVSLLFVVQ